MRVKGRLEELQTRWLLDCTLAKMLVALEDWAESWFTFQKTGVSFWPGLRIISGQRSPEENQAAGGASGSLHLVCPGRAADLRVGTIEGVPDRNIWGRLGAQWMLMGGRWGGSFSDEDLNHFDLGI